MTMAEYRGYFKMMLDMTIREFTEQLASSSPTPGGGGVSALAGALAVALGSMAGNLSVGKKKEKEDQKVLSELLSTADVIRNNLLQLVEEDARAFLPLAKAYAIPKQAPERETVLEQCLEKAASVPLRILDLSVQTSELMIQLEQYSSRIALSDIGCGATMCSAAMHCALLNVFANTRLMKDRQKAESINQSASGKLKIGQSKMEELYRRVGRNLS